MTDPSDIVIRQARAQDVQGLAEVFVAAFPESVQHVAGSLSTTRGLQDMFSLILDAEPEALHVAEDQGRLAGYVLSPSRTSRLRSVALWRGHALRAAWRWLTGQYGVRWRSIVTSLHAKIAFLRYSRVGESAEARILSMAVHPDYQGKRLGKRLLATGLEYLAGKQVPAVRLEVRPDNAPARHLYEQAGFDPVGTYADAQGPWLVMIKRTGAAAPKRGRRKWRRWVLLGLVLLVAGVTVPAFLLNRPFYLANLRLRAQMPFFAIPGPGQRVLIFAPHPDDETLGCAGLIQQAQAAGAEVYVALMTNGDASDYSVWYYEREVRPGPQDYLALGRTRQKESRAGLAVLGVPADHLYTLGYPNGGLENLWQPAAWLPSTPWTSPRTRVAANPYAGTFHPEAAYCGSNVLGDVHRLLETIAPDMILVPAPFDVHPDHWATYDFVTLAAEQRSLRGYRSQPALYCYVVHRRDWPAPVGYHPYDLLQPPADYADVPHLNWLALPLEEEQVFRKSRALGMYRSQGPQFDRLLLAFVRANELFCDLAPEEYGRPEVVLTEPIGDQPTLKRMPGADLALVTLGMQPGGVRASLTVAGQIDPRVTYSLLGHSPQPSGPVAWEVKVTGSKGSLTWIEGEALQSQPVAATVQGEMLTVTVPAELAQGHLLMVEAFTKLGRRYLDHTTTRAVELLPGVAAEGR